MKPPKSLYIEVCLKKYLCKHLDIIFLQTNSQHTHIIDFFVNLCFGCNHLLSLDRVDFQCTDKNYLPLFNIIDWSFPYWFIENKINLSWKINWKQCQISLRRNFQSCPYTSIITYSCPQCEIVCAEWQPLEIVYIVCIKIFAFDLCCYSVVLWYVIRHLFDIRSIPGSHVTVVVQRCASCWS